MRWIIIAGVVGFPLMLIGSWFLESPWKGRRGISIAGDILVIVAIAVAAILFAWQQWFSSTTRPIVAVLSIEATDTREDRAYWFWPNLWLPACKSIWVEPRFREFADEVGYIEYWEEVGFPTQFDEATWQAQK